MQIESRGVPGGIAPARWRPPPPPVLPQGAPPHCSAPPPALAPCTGCFPCPTSRVTGHSMLLKLIAARATSPWVLLHMQHQPVHANPSCSGGGCARGGGGEGDAAAGQLALPPCFDCHALPVTPHHHLFAYEQQAAHAKTTVEGSGDYWQRWHASAVWRCTAVTPGLAPRRRWRAAAAPSPPRLPAARLHWPCAAPSPATSCLLLDPLLSPLPKKIRRDASAHCW